MIGSWRRARLAARLLTGSGAGACEALVGGWRLDGDRLGGQSQRRAWITGRWRRRPLAAGAGCCGSAMLQETRAGFMDKPFNGIVGIKKR